ncbi:MAG TPA: hypothetical protein VGB90_02660 [Alphaproteobacteria bacterium]
MRGPARILADLVPPAAALVLLASPTLACVDFSKAPSSRWTTRQEGGAQFLVTPCGDRFFSLGVNIVGPVVPADEANDGRRYDWRRHYPSLEAWIAKTRERLAAWGFNTLGAWSRPLQQLDMPSAVYLGLGVDGRYHWLDPFDPETEERVRVLAREMVAPFRGDPRRIGYFTDNETGWWSGALFHWTSRGPADNHTKRRWVETLRAHYGGAWRRFAADFAVPDGVASWEVLRDVTRPTRLRAGTRGIEAVRLWTATVAEHYYATVARALREADPEALLLGDRLPIYYDPVAVRPMARHMDVLGVNYNIDAHDGWVARYFFDGLAQLSGGKPVMVTEWFLAAHANRSGNRNVGHLLTVTTQAERARSAAAATLNLAAIPEVVGAHWFQWPDHPPGGRSDGEDYNFGLVDVDDRPYEALVAALAAANRIAPERHAAARRADAAEGAFRVPYARINVADTSLADWPKPAALLPPLAPAPGEVAFGEAYLAWDEAGLSFATIGQDYYDIDFLASEGPFPLSEGYRIALGVDAGAGPHRVTLFFIPPARRGKDYPIMTPLLCVDAPSDIAACRAPEGGKAVYFGSDQPRIVAEARLPWAALGLAGPPPSGRLAVEVTGTAWHRARWMSLSGLPPAEALASPARWRVVALAPPGAGE